MFVPDFSGPLAQQEAVNQLNKMESTKRRERDYRLIITLLLRRVSINRPPILLKVNMLES